MKNTKRKGKFTIFTYQYRENHFIGVCLEFDLITEGETAIEAIKNIFSASINYLRTIIKNDLNDKLLNLTPEQKYLREYTRLLKGRAKKIEKIERPEKKKKEKLIPWDKYFSSQDFQYNPKFLKDIKKEETCV
jgi:hypothetical protein